MSMPMLSLVAVIITALLLSCVATATAAAGVKSSDKSSSFAVVGYLPEWRYGGANFEK
jgi:hypothetical protein